MLPRKSKTFLVQIEMQINSSEVIPTNSMQIKELCNWGCRSFPCRVKFCISFEKRLRVSDRVTR
jgi:hypothetical protein